MKRKLKILLDIGIVLVICLVLFNLLPAKKTITTEDTFWKDTWRILKDLTGITGFATGALVNTTAGAAPFYTNNTNPLTQLNLSCLTSMHDNNSCEAEWYVNATGSIGNISEFFAFVNGTNYSLTNISNNLSITIKSCITGESCSRAGYTGSTYSSDCVCSGGTQTSISSSSSSSSGGGGSPPVTKTKKETTETEKKETNDDTEEVNEEEKTEDFFETIIRIEKSEISESELQLRVEGIMDKFWKTQKYSKIVQPPEFIYNNETNTTEVIYKIVPLNATLFNYSLYINISKCAALYADMVSFKEDYNFEVLIEDPLFKLSFDEVKEPITISYKVRGEILEYCKKLLLALGIAENVFEPPKPKQMALSPSKITYRDIIISFKNEFPGSLLALIPFFIILVAVFAYEEAHTIVEHGRRTKARKIIRIASRAVIDLTLAATIAGNIAEFSGILSPYLSVLENVLGIVFATYLIYKVNIPRLILGIKSRLVDISIITAYYLIISNIFLGLKLAGISQFFSTLVAYLTPAVNILLFLGVVIIAALSLLLAISADIKKPSLMSILKQEGKPKNILDIAARFLFLSIILLSFSYIAFKPFVEWVTIAVDAPIFMGAICIFIFSALNHHKKLTIKKIIEEPIEKEESFYKKFFEEFEFKRKIVFGVSGLLALNALVDAFVFLLPNDFYMESISVSGHIPVTAYIIKELPLVSNISKVTLPYAYILNMIFIFSILALPMLILYKLITDKKLIFKKWLVALFFSSFMAYLLMPAYKIGQLTAEKVIGADIQTKSILYSDFLIKRLVPSQAMALTLVVSLSLLTILFVHAFYKRWSRLFSMAMVSLAVIFFAMHVYYYISSTWFYALDIVVNLAAKTALDRNIGMIKIILLFAATIFYYIIFFIFIGKIFLEYRKEEKLSKEHEKHAKKLAKWISNAHKAGLKPRHTQKMLKKAGWPKHIIHHAHKHAKGLGKND